MTSIGMREGGDLPGGSAAGALRTALPIALAVTLAACVVGPDYVTPPVELPAAFTVGSPAEPAHVRWWTHFDDPVLDALVAGALVANLDLQVAVARVAQARAARERVAGERLPSAEASANLGRTRDLSAADDGSVSPADVDRGDGGLLARWEPDLYGRVGRATEGAGASLGAAEADRDGVRLAVVAEVARTYFELRGFETRAELQRQGFRSQTETAAITDRLFEAGAAAGVDRVRARAQAASTAAAILMLEAERVAAANRIAVLLGTTPGALAERLGTQRGSSAILPSLDAGVPADLLRRRPDIRAAERRLAASYAAIGVATTDLYPRLVLTGSVGGAAARVDAGDVASGGIWSALAGLAAPLFDGGRRRALVRQREAERDEALAVHRRTVLAAVEEVETTLVRYERARLRGERLAEAVEDYATADRSLRESWRVGEASFLDVLDAERSLIGARDALAAGDVETSVAAVRLYAALGGGWETSAPEASHANGKASPSS